MSSYGAFNKEIENSSNRAEAVKEENEDQNNEEDSFSEDEEERGEQQWCPSQLSLNKIEESVVYHQQIFDEPPLVL